MRIVQAAFWTAAFASSLMTLALVIPFWLGRKDEQSGVTLLHGAFYNLKCAESSFCEAYSDVLDSNLVPLDGREWKVNIVGIPVLAIIGWIACFLAVTIIEILNCRCCTRVRTRKILLVVTVLLMLSVLFTVLAFFFGVHASDEYYTDNGINNVQEFPWSLFLWAIATVLVIAATILFMIIVCKWHKYKDHYGYHYMWDKSFDSSSHGRYDIATKYGSRGKSPEFGYVPHRESGFTNVGMITPALSESNLFDFHGLSKSNNAGNAILKSSGRTMYDSPALVRAANRKTMLPRISDIQRSTSYEDFLESVSQKGGGERPLGRFTKSTADIHRIEEIGKPVIVAASQPTFIQA